MNPPSANLIAALERGELMPCALPHREGVRPWANFYCAGCGALRCASCVIFGFCPVCRAIVRSTGAILLATKEN